MSRSMLTVCLGLVAACLLLPAQARQLQLRIAKVSMPAASLTQVRVRLDWAQGAQQGALQMWVAAMDAPDIGIHYRDLHWRCPLQRTPAGGWRCSGALRAGRDRPLQLALEFDVAQTRASLSQAAANLTVVRNAASPDLTLLQLQQVPLQWAQALLQQVWPAAHFKAGNTSAELRLETSSRRPLRVDGKLRVAGAGLETADASIVGEGLGGEFQIDYTQAARTTRLAVTGALHQGEFLAGNTYVALPESPVQLQMEARQQPGQGWVLPRIHWHDGEVLQAQAALQLDQSGGLQQLTVHARSADMGPLKSRYLSGWMGILGLDQVALQGAFDAEMQMLNGSVQAAHLHLHGVDLRDPDERFVFDGLQGDLRYSAADPVAGMLSWSGGKLYGLDFGKARLPMTSQHGEVQIPGRVWIPMMGGKLGLRDLQIRPAQADAGTTMRFGLQLEDIDFGRVSQVLGLPAFQGRLSGNIRSARYGDARIDFDGGLSLRIFDGKVAFSSLALERPFGTAPSLVADIEMDGLDLTRLTEVLGFGSVSGRLDGRIDGLRLVNWSPVAFNARFITEDVPDKTRRISQRAVQDISSVGGGGLLQSLQGKLIGLFDDFGYRRIGIGCRLHNQVCTMSGLHSGNNTFTIIEGAGVPRLDVVGHNRVVDWPTLVERLLAASRGEVAPVIN